MTSKLLGQAIGLSGTTGNSTNLTVSSNGALQLAANGGTDIYISANDNIGFGTSSPAAKLHIASGNIRLADQNGIEWGGANNFIYGNNVGNFIDLYTNNARAARFDNSGRLLLGGLTAAYGSSGEVLTVNGMITAISNTNSAQNSTLYLYNTNRAASNNQPYITFHDGESLRARMGVNYTDGALWIQGAFGTYFRNNSNEVARFDSSGKFGIGTNNPQNVLDLGQGTNGIGIVWGGSNGLAQYSSIWTAYSYGHLTLATGYKPDLTADNFLSSFNSGSMYRNAIRLDAYDANGIRFFTNTPANSAIGTVLAPTERMRIQSDGKVRIGGSGYLAARNPLDVPESMITSYTYYEKSNTSTPYTYIGKGSGSTENIQLYLHNAADMIFYTSGSERMRIDSSGRITSPAQPCFYAYYTTNTNLTTGEIVYTASDPNVGSHYNTSTGRFTAPVAGNYYFSHSTFGDVGASTSSYFYVRFLKNGSYFGGITHSQHNDTRSYETISTSICGYLNAGDYVSVYFVGVNAKEYSGYYSQFSGFLIG